MTLISNKYDSLHIYFRSTIYDTVLLINAISNITLMNTEFISIRRSQTQSLNRTATLTMCDCMKFYLGWHIYILDEHGVALIPPATGAQLSIGVAVTTHNTK